MNIKLGVVGGGCVGHATARCFIEHVDEVRVFDVVRERATHSLDETLACDLIMLALPTPQKSDSLECDTSAIEDFFEARTLNGVRPHANANYVIRSTVPVGFTRRMASEYNLPNLCHSPEFLTARVAVTDAQLPARNIVGDPTPAKFNSAAKILEGLYRLRFPGVPCIVCTSDESEFVKLMQNGFFATKIAYFNEMQQYAAANGLDWSVVLGAMLLDGRISHSHTKVPGPDGKYGFGPDTPQNCLKKDLANLITCIKGAGQTPHVTLAAHTRNVEDRKR